MSRMMGTVIRNRYLYGYCYPGHDGTWRDRIKTERSAQRSREKRQWRREHYFF